MAGEIMLAVVLAVAAGLAALDQLFKWLVVENIAVGQTVPVLGNVFSLTYVRNEGVAFGMFQHHVWLFAVITLLLIGVFIWLIVARKFTGKLFAISAMLMIGGGIGNLIDRLFRQYVVDYLSLSFFPPVCNFADYCITIGAFLFIVVLFLQEGSSKSKKAIKETAVESQRAEEEALQEPAAEALKAEESDLQEPAEKTDKAPEEVATVPDGDTHGA